MFLFFTYPPQISIQQNLLAEFRKIGIKLKSVDKHCANLTPTYDKKID